MTPYRRNLLLLGLITALMLSFGWVGYSASDDAFYIRAAEGWLHDFPFVGSDHWSLRHPYVLSIAASFATFGVGEAALTLVGVGAFVVTLLVVYGWVSREFDASVGLAAGAIIASLPLFAVSASIPTADSTELLLVIASLTVFCRAVTAQKPKLLLWSGVLIGLAWLTRETSATLVVFYALLFVVGYGLPRRYYWLLALGFAVPALAEYLYLFSHTGDPLYRLNIDLHHGSNGRPEGLITPQTGNLSLATSIAAGAGAGVESGAASSTIGYYSQIFDPLLALLVNQEFMLLYWLLPIAAVWGWRGKDIDRRQRNMMRVLIGLILLWIVTLGYMTPTRALPRYFEVTSVAAAIILAGWLMRGIWPRRRWLAIAIGGSLIAGNLVGIYIENKQPIFGVRALVAWAESHGEPIYTDPRTFKKAELLIRERGLDGLILRTRTPLQAPYWYNRNQLLRASTPAAYRRSYTPPKDWVVTNTIAQQPRWIGTPLAWLGLDDYLSANLLRRLIQPARPASVMRPPALATTAP